MHAHVQPLLHDETIVFRAPTQSWSAADGSMGSRPIHGVYFSDVRLLSAQSITVNGRPLEHRATVPHGATSASFVSLARQLDDETADPGVRVDHRRTARVEGLDETIVFASRLAHPIAAEVVVTLVPDDSAMDAVKAGQAIAEDGAPRSVPDATARRVVLRDDGSAGWGSDQLAARLTAPGATLTVHEGMLRLTWSVTVPARGSVELGWSISATDERAVVRGVTSPVPWTIPIVSAGDDRLERWISRSLDDLDALRLTTVAEPNLQFLAAGTPWFLTLFGRDSIWAARFLLPLGTRIAGDTLRVLAGLQGGSEVAETAEEPGKIMHELRRDALELPGEGVHLPPLYFGTVDATALWICLLHDAWRWGMPDDEVRALLPHLERALEWMRDSGDADGDGLLEYIDKSGRGLANQGWKDSGDSVQWKDGTLADGPIALCEVQAYAFEAATHGADLLEHFGVGVPREWRDWAFALRDRFNESFWIEDTDGAYPAIALDSAKRPVDTVTSNLGHLLGTGLLDERQTGLVARRLVSAQLNSGFGLRTMSTDSAGYWPLSYHGGSVWTHDTAIAIAGLAREGFGDEAGELIRGLLAASSGFDYRMPELHSGDAATESSVPIPYPAACRPQAWSAAAAVSVLGSILGLRANAQDQSLAVSPTAVVGALTVDGLRLGDAIGSVSINGDGEVTGSSGIQLVVG
jgi:glycogen debranching enzyme